MDIQNLSKFGVFKSYTTKSILLFTIIILLWLMTSDQIQAYINQGRSIENRFRKSSVFIDIGKMVWGFLHDLGHITYSLVDIRILKNSLQKISEEETVDSQKIQDAIDTTSRIEDMLITVDQKQDQIKKMVRAKHVIEKEKIDFNAMIANLLNYLKITYDLRNINLDLHLSHKKIYIFASPFEILQAIENIIRNSIEAIIENNGNKLTISTSITDGKAKLFIADTGGGIKFIDKNGRVDLEEFQIGRTTKEEYGTGWGMYSAVLNIQHNSGQLQINTLKDVGTNFEIFFDLNGGKNG